MRAVLFGTGRDLGYLGHLFRNMQIVAVLDNDVNKQGKVLRLADIIKDPDSLTDQTEPCHDIVVQLQKKNRTDTISISIDPEHETLCRERLQDKCILKKNVSDVENGVFSSEVHEKDCECIKIDDPPKIADIYYDFIFLCSREYYVDMTQQLLRLHVPFYKIVAPFEIALKLGEAASPVSRYMIDTRAQKQGIKKVKKTNSCYLFSHLSNHTGAPIALWHMARVLKKFGFRVVFVCGTMGALYQELDEDGIEILTDPDINSMALDQLPYTDDIDIAIVNTAFLGNLLLSHRKIRHVFWWIHEPSFMYKIGNTVMARAADLSNTDLWFVSEAAAENFCEARGKKEPYTILPFYVENRKICAGDRKEDAEDIISENRKSGQSFSPISQGNDQYERNPGKMIFGMVGSIDDNKNQAFFAKCICKIPQEIAQEAQFCVIGQANQKMLRKVSAADTERRLQILPPRDRRGMDDFFRHLDVLICISREESFPTVCIEAMSYGDLCIMTDHIPVASYLKNGENALIIPTRDEAALTDAIIWCIRNRDKVSEMGWRGHFVYEKNFTEEIFENRLKKVICRKREF